jgi:hypothetical protein
MRTYINRNLWGYERSLNQTSTTSRLMSVRPPSSHHHHLRPRQLNSLPTACNHPARSSSPLLRDVSPIDSAPSKYRNTDPMNTRGDPSNGRPTWYVTKANHDQSRGSFSPFFSFLLASDHICPTPTFRPTLAHRIRHEQPTPTMATRMTPAWRNTDPTTKSRTTRRRRDPM